MIVAEPGSVIYVKTARFEGETRSGVGNPQNAAYSGEIAEPISISIQKPSPTARVCHSICIGADEGT